MLPLVVVGCNLNYHRGGASDHHVMLGVNSRNFLGEGPEDSIVSGQQLLS